MHVSFKVPICHHLWWPISSTVHPHYSPFFAVHATTPWKKNIDLHCATKKGTISYMGVSKNSGTPKWMLIVETPIKMDDLGVLLFLETSIYKSRVKSFHLGTVSATFLFPTLVILLASPTFTENSLQAWQKEKIADICSCDPCCTWWNIPENQLKI